jgi:hypothetical protein
VKTSKPNRSEVWQFYQRKVDPGQDTGKGHALQQQRMDLSSNGLFAKPKSG